MGQNDQSITPCYVRVLQLSLKVLLRHGCKLLPALGLRVGDFGIRFGLLIFRWWFRVSVNGNLVVLCSDSDLDGFSLGLDVLGLPCVLLKSGENPIPAR